MTLGRPGREAVTEAHGAPHFRGWGGPTLVRIASAVRGRGWYTRSPVLRLIYRLAIRLTGQRIATVHGHDIEIDASDSLRLLVWGDYELAETAWYRATIQEGDTVVEVGAHIGVFTTLFASLVSERGSVIAFEPDPDNARLLRANLARNGYPSVRVFEAAAGAAEGKTRFYRSKSNTGDNRLFGDRNEATHFDVQVLPLDDVLADLGQIAVLKLDVQGAEPLVIEGMSGILANKPPKRILCEFWPHGMTGMGSDPRSFLDRIAAFGYELQELDKLTGRALPLDPEEICARLTPESKDWANLVATHREALNSGPPGSLLADETAPR